MKFTTTVRVKQVAWDELKSVCPNCGHEDVLKADMPGMTEERDAEVEFLLPDKLLTRGSDGRATGSVETVNLLREWSEQRADEHDVVRPNTP